MARKMYCFTFTVRSNNKTRNFPMDMLRYDGCYPASSLDVARMTLAPDKLFDAGTEIKLEKIADKGWEPEKARWSSFGWTVVSYDLITEVN